MKALLLIATTLAFLTAGFQLTSISSGREAAHAGYLGFDRNDYPGDSNLKILRQTFAYSGYWLNNPPGAKTNSWTGKRKTLQAAGFGFLVLFNGRTYAEIKLAGDAVRLGVPMLPQRSRRRARKDFHCRRSFSSTRNKAGVFLRNNEPIFMRGSME